MTKKRRRRGAGPPPNPAGPKVHVKVALGGANLSGAAALIKPAVLYADDVTVYSPAASMLSEIRRLGRVTDPREQFLVMVSLARDVPALRGKLDMTDEDLHRVLSALSTRRRAGKGRAEHEGGEQLRQMVDQMSSIWAERIPEALEAATANIGADELLIAVERGAVKVADLSETPSAMIAEGLRLATGGKAGDPTDNLLENFMGRMIEMVVEPKTFPLFDAHSSGLLRAVEGVVGPRDRHATMRAAEVSAAASFMGFLPNFTYMPMDEAIDLRRELKAPLKRFRAALARMSRDFESRPPDESFNVEVEDLWRREVEPALAEIRETLAEHGLLREVASVALGNPIRLISEAGGVVAAAHGEVLSLSGLLTAGAASAVPAADLLGRAVLERSRSRRAVRKHAFYFLHRVGDQP